MLLNPYHFTINQFTDEKFFVKRYNYAMPRKKKDYQPTTSDIKILETVQLLNAKNLYPLPQGVHKILSASGEPEYIIYHDVPTYGTLLSYSSKHISRLVMMLLRYGYLERIYDQKSDELYLKLSEKGDLFLFNYHRKHKYSFKKKSGEKRPLIVEIK